MSYEITYENLGRGKASGKTIIKELNYKELNGLFKKFYRSELDFITDENTGKGKIYFGWCSQPFMFKKLPEGSDD